MLAEFRKSINSILYQRVTSPFWGAAIASWSVWNWKIIYVTFFASSSDIDGSKMEYIEEYLGDAGLWGLVWGPLSSLFLLLTVFPFISNGAYWLNLKFNNWKRKQKIKLENEVPLTIEQSIELRDQILKQEDRFTKLLKEKDDAVELSLNKVNSLQHKARDLERQLEQRTINNQEALQEIKEKESFTSIFPGKWVYDNFETKKVFEIRHKKGMYFLNPRENYSLKLIEGDRSQGFTFLMYSESTRNRNLSFKFVAISRNRSEFEYKGKELTISVKDNEASTEIKDIIIYDQSSKAVNSES